MRKILILLFALTIPTFTQAQTIALGQITQLAYCVGDTLTVPYQASGDFTSDNVFKVQLSSASGSFSTFTNLGQNSALTGTITITMSATGDHFRVRIISTDPYVASNDNGADIQVVGYPSPLPQTANGLSGGIGGAGFVDDPIQLLDGSTEPAGSIDSWIFFDSSASIHSTPNAAPVVSYSSEGEKTVTLTVTNSVGCSTTARLNFAIMSCFPTIPATAHIVTGTESGSEPAVWVRSGGNFTATLELSPQIIYVEPGASLTTSWRSNGLYYLRAGSSFSDQAGPFGETAVYTPGFPLSGLSSLMDTLSCPNLTFNYSQIEPSIVETPMPSNLTILQSGDHLFANDEGLTIEIRISNLLGAEVLSQSGNGAMDIDVSPLPAGIYFAVVQAGSERQVQKIAVVH